jgi:hypothetical protein
VDAIEVDSLDRAAPILPLWYRLLNAGVRLPPVGGSGKDGNRVALGGVRTLTPKTGDGSYAEWVGHVKAGRTVVTNGPFLRLIVDDQPSPRPVRLRAEAASVVPFERLELVGNGRVLESATATGAGVSTAILEAEVCPPDGGWFAARCVGAAKPELYPHIPALAHTSPVWIDVGGRPAPRAPNAVAALRREIDGVRTWVETDGRFTNPRRKEHLLALCDAATARLGGPP